MGCGEGVLVVSLAVACLFAVKARSIPARNARCRLAYAHNRWVIGLAIDSVGLHRPCGVCLVTFIRPKVLWIVFSKTASDSKRQHTHH